MLKFKEVTPFQQRFIQAAAVRIVKAGTDGAGAGCCTDKNIDAVLQQRVAVTMKNNFAGAPDAEQVGAVIHVKALLLR